MQAERLVLFSLNYQLNLPISIELVEAPILGEPIDIYTKTLHSDEGFHLDFGEVGTLTFQHGNFSLIGWVSLFQRIFIVPKFKMILPSCYK